MKLSKKSFVVIYLIYGLILTALATKNGGLLLLAIPFLLYLIIGLYQAPTSLAIRAERIIAGSSIHAGEPTEIQILIENLGEDLENLHIQDQVLPGLKIIDGQVKKQTSLAAQDQTRVKYIIEASRNIYSWQNIVVSASDPLGLFEINREIPAPGELLVRPVPIQIRPVTLKPRATLHTSGPIPARLSGTGTDFWSVREYRPGDSYRWINWRLTNRHFKKMFTNEYEREEIADYGIILDARRMYNSDSLEAEIFEYSTSVTASLCENLIRSGNRVSLLVLGKPILQVYPGYGKGQLNALMVNLSRAKLGGNIKLRNLDYFPPRLFPARSLILVLSLVGQRDLKFYARLRAYGYEVLLISPDSITYAVNKSRQKEEKSLAFRTARIERILQLQKIMKLGIKIIDWEVDKPVDPLIRRIAQSATHRRNI